MKRDFWRTRWFLAAVIIVILASAFTLLALRTHYHQEEDAVLEYFSRQEGMPQTFDELENLTPSDAVVLCWWDYGRAVREWSGRDVIEAYPSRDIWYTVASNRDLWHNLAAQIFGVWGSSEKIHDLADIFMLPEEQAIQIMRRYEVSYAVVFTPDDLQKFHWIAQIAGYNGSDYLTSEEVSFTPTALGSQATLLRLLFDDEFNPQYFNKLFDNGKGKIFQVFYT